ncbi:hypothetical protein CXU19_11080 [Akkermansia muciniphila]|nr:hypothetical protein CXU19_11080 [Akkermansia muciniphila]PNC36988.1 hypothetical protein CXU20_13380 [Akkermansia muciniphila]
MQHLRFVLPSGEVDTQFNGMTIRGGVLDDGIRDMPGSEIIDGRCALQLPRLAAGCHRYDVLVSGDGTDKPLLAGVIHVAPRVTPVDVDDNAPADYLDIVIPEDEGGTITVISESPAWVDDAVEKSLQERGMYVTPVDGETVLTMSTGTSTRDFNYFTFALNSTYVSGHLAASYRLNKIALQTPSSEANGTRWMARLCRYSAGLALPLEVLGTSTATASWTSINASTMECHWNFDGIAVSAADRLVLEVYAVDSSGTTVSKALIAYGAAASHGGTEGVLIASGDKLAWRNYSRLALSMSVAYDAGVSVGGIELASRRHFDSLAASVVETGKQIADDADAAQQAREEAEQIASGMTLTAGTITTGAPGSQAAAELKPGSTAGSYTLHMTIPRGDVGTVDTSQAYTWTQPQTYDAMINANGGINIPLAAGAPMDMMAVNRLYAAGMAGVTNIYTQRTYLDTGSITATGAAASTAIIPGQYAKTVIPANTHSTVVHNFIGPVGQWNYSSFAGLSVPWQLSAAGKFAIGIGRGNKTVRKDLTLDSYSIIPGNDLAYNTGEILDITFTNVRDTTRSGYEIRVREIYCTESTQRWKVKTTTSFIPASGNEPIPYIVNKIIYQQYAPRSYIAGDYGDAYGALYLLTGGGSNQQLWKIATVRGVTTFETGPGFSSIVSDVLGVSGGSVGLFVGTAERTNYQPGNVNPVYYALEAITNNAIETEETTDFEDINVPIG